MKRVSKALEKMVDIVLAYKPISKVNPPRKRSKKKTETKDKGN